MLTNQVPFDGADHLEILFKQISEAAEPPSSPEPSLGASVDDVLAWVMAKSVDERPATLCDAVEQLEKASDPEYKLDRKVLGTDVTMLGEPPAAEARVVASKSAKIGLVAAALGAVAVVAYLLFPGGSDEPEAIKPGRAEIPVVEATQIPPEPLPGDRGLTMDPPDAGALPSVNVTVRISGPPTGTEVYGPTGLLGVLPGSVQIPRGSESVQLSFRAPGYQSTSRQVEADADQAIEVELLTLEPTKTAPPKPLGTKAGKAGRKHGRDAIEDPFAD